MRRALNQRVSGAKAMQLLGWKPKGVSVMEDLEHGSYLN